MIDVLDHGYVRLVDSMGTDLSVVNAARVSYDKESAGITEADERLLKYLWKHGHTSPFRHALVTFEVYAPLMVARQWWKYVIGSSHLGGDQDNMVAWNESSRRYITEEPKFYTPASNEWRSAPENSKQGSGDNVPEALGFQMTADLKAYIERGETLYNRALDAGIAAEQARLFIPAYGVYVRWRWTASLHGILHFLEQRLAHDAQAEITEYAKAVQEHIKTLFPATYAATTAAAKETS